MRLSDAIATGRVLIKRWTNSQTLKDCEGCAMGAALLAVNERLGDEEKVYRHWPWLKERNGWWMITGMFDKVMRGTMTLDQLIDWVRSVEPEETPSPIEAGAIEEAHAEVGEKHLTGAGAGHEL